MILLFAAFILIVAFAIMHALPGYLGNLIAMALIVVSALITGVLLSLMDEQPTPKPRGAEEAEQIAMLEKIYRMEAK